MAFKRQNRGSVIVLVLTVLGISTLLLAALLQLIEVANKQTAISRDMVRYRTVLDSLLDYTLHGVKQRWCFSNFMLEDTCNWNHPASTERLIMSDNMVRSLSEMKFNNPTFPADPPFRLERIEVTVPISAIASTHPLFRAIQPARNAIFTDIKFEVWRVSNVNMPQHGDESILEIHVTLNSSTSLFGRFDALSARSTIFVFPRQLNQFSLIVPRDLRLDLPDSNSDVGDANIARFATRSSSGQGLVFESPVFVNRNVHVLPNSPGASNPPYAPATFAQRVIIGNGRIFESTTLMTPVSPGGEISRTYDQLSGLGGFLRGVEIDGNSDRGLDVFTGRFTPPPVDQTLANECRNYLASKTDLTLTRDSPLYVQQAAPVVAPTMSVTYNLVLGGNNAFLPQRVRSNVNASPTPPPPLPPEQGGWKETPTISPHSPAVGYLYASFGALSLNWIKARIGMNNELSFTFIDNSGANADPQMTIRLNPVSAFGHDQPNQARLSISVSPGGDLSKIPSPFRLYFKAFDYATNNGADRRRDNATVNSLNPSFLREANFEFTVVPGSGILPVPYSTPLGNLDSHQRLFHANCTGILPLPIPPVNGFIKGSACTGAGPLVPATSAANPFSNSPASPAVDYGEFKERCEQHQSGQGTSFGMAEWGSIEFLASTRYSWHFNPVNANQPVSPYPAPITDVLVFDDTTNDQFVVHSIVGLCRISAQASRVQALLGCDRLVIEPRVTPLIINGTIIAGQTNISPSALQAGIRWRSLRHSQTVYDLRANTSLLRQHDFSACTNTLPIPEFSPVASIEQMSTQQNCSPLRLAQAADPFNWSTVDPDCGLRSGSSFMSCKRRPLRYQIREISRSSD